MSIAVGPLQFSVPVVLAPMSGVTDLPFRRLVKRLGADLVVSEMIASQSMIRQSKESLKLAGSCPEEFPMAVQLAGCDPAVMAEAARLNADRRAALIDPARAATSAARPSRSSFAERSGSRPASRSPWVSARG